MGATIKVNCENCKTMMLEPKDIVELVRADEHSPGFYAFSCPECGALQRRPVPDNVIDVLISVGVAETSRLTQEEINKFVSEMDIEDYLAEIVLAENDNENPAS